MDGMTGVFPRSHLVVTPPKRLPHTRDRAVRDPLVALGTVFGTRAGRDCEGTTPCTTTIRTPPKPAESTAPTARRRPGTTWPGAATPTTARTGKPSPGLPR